MTLKAANTPDPDAWGLPGFLCEPPLDAPDPLVVLRRAACSLSPDEARVDRPAFDRNAMGNATDLVTQAAALAFEIASSWCIEPMRALYLARELPKAVALAQSS